jgi:hypothetical protein
VTGGNPGQVNSRPILAVLARSPASLDRVVASLVVTGIFALAMIVAAGRPAVVLAPAATGVLLAFEVGALLARERETSARSE